MIVFKKLGGRASDLRFAADDYVLAKDELVLSAEQWPEQDTLPELASLHDAAVVAADAHVAERGAISDQRDGSLATGTVAWNGRNWHIDETFQLHLTGFCTAFDSGILPAAATVAIRSADNDIVQLGQADVKALAGAVLGKVQGIWAASWAAKDALK